MPKSKKIQSQGNSKLKQTQRRIEDPSGIRKKKRCQSQPRKYSTHDLQQALNLMSEENLSYRQVAQRFHIPKSTLYVKKAGLTPLDCRRGPCTILTTEEEKSIETWLIECANRGFPITKCRLLDFIKKYVEATGRKNPFRNGRPGDKWYNSFMSRHPVLTLRVAQNLTTTRASVSKENLTSWFDEVYKYLVKRELEKIPARRKFNSDESAYQLVPKGETVIARKGARSVYTIVGCSEKTCVTVLFTAGADGTLAPPLILFEQKTVPKKSVLEYIPSHWGVGVTEGGWMTAESWHSYIVNIFYPWLVENGYDFPVILFVDNHSSHTDYETLKFCEEKKIELIALYPNSTHIIQPLDIAFFRPLKKYYKDELVQYRIENEVIDFKKYMVAPVLDAVLENKQEELKIAIQNGFKAAGLEPFDKTAVNYDILNKNQKQKQVCDNSHTSGVSVGNKDGHDDQAIRHQQFLDYFEVEVLEPDVLQMFLSNGITNVWTGEPVLKCLFECWKKMKLLSENSNPCVPEIVIDLNDSDPLDLEGSSITTVNSSFQDPNLESNNASVGDLADRISTVQDDLQFSGLSACESSNDSGIGMENSNGNNPPYQIQCIDTMGQTKTLTVFDILPGTDATNEDIINSSEVGLNEKTKNFPSSSLEIMDYIDTVQVKEKFSDQFLENVRDDSFLSQSFIDETSHLEINCDETPLSNSELLVTSQEGISWSNTTSFAAEKSSSLKFSDRVSTTETNIVHKLNPCDILNNERDLNNDTCCEDEVSKDFYVPPSHHLSSEDECPVLDLSTGKSSFTLGSNDLHVDKMKAELARPQNMACDENKILSSVDKKEHFNKIFKLPEPISKKSKKVKPQGTSAYGCKDMLKIAEKKEDEKKLKEEEIKQSKEKREKNKSIKEKELNINKSFKENKMRLQKQKKDLLSEMKVIKSTMKRPEGKAKLVQLKENLESLKSQLEEIERDMTILEMEALQSRIKVKQEKV